MERTIKDKVIASFEAHGVRYQLIECDGGRDGYIVFTRVLNNWDLDDVDVFNRKDSAIARFLYLVSINVLDIPNYGKTTKRNDFPLH